MSSLSTVLLLSLLTAAPAPEGSLRRFGLFFGSNDGGPGRTQLRYATTDAEAMAHVLERLGGLAREDVALLIAPTRAQLSAELERLRARVARAKASGARTELILYYSGHADESGLLLGRDRMPYGELRRAIDLVPAHVRVAILDSCHAGSFVRLKGGKRIAPFLVDASSAVQGHAFLSSSSAEEAAQESDRIRSSFFTFALLSGLRGAADSSRDGKVTLSEAYHFAFQETLASTERSIAGPQHPAYDIHLAGTGDLVMTDLRAQTAGLVIPADVAGRVYVRDASGRLVVELHHAAGHALELGLEPGSYGVRLDTGAGVLETRAVLAEGKRVMLRRADFAPAGPGEVVARRGPEPERAIPLHLSIWHPLSNAGEGEPPVASFSLNLFYGRIAELRGVEVGAGLNLETRRMAGAQLGLVNVVRGEAQGVQYGLANWASGDAYGLQNGAVLNQAGGNFHGLQNGVLYNGVGGELRGVQLSAGANVARNMRGAQAGLVNVVREAAPLQIGLVNVSGSSGAAIGLVNVADEAAAPIGMVNWVRDGYRALALWGSDLAATNVGVKLGGRYTYTLLGVGAQPFRRPERFFGIMGLGVHVPIGAWFLDVDAIVSGVISEGGFHEALLPTALRVVAVREIVRGVSLTLGPTWNVVVGWDGADADLALFPQDKLKDGATTVRQFPGFVLGLQI